MCLGNEYIHLLTYDSRQVVRIDMEDWEGRKVHMEYDNFAVGCEAEKYKLVSVGKKGGNGG